MYAPAEPGQRTPVASWEHPFEMLRACHERVQRMLNLLGKLQAHVVRNGVDEQAQQAARDVMRYFDQAAPLHHEDEEIHVFPAAQRLGNSDVIAAVHHLHAEHHGMEAAWQQLRVDLQTLLDLPPSAPLPPAWQTVEQVQHFRSLYGEHIRIEEELVYPLVEAGLTPESTEAMGREMSARRGAGVPAAAPF